MKDLKYFAAFGLIVFIAVLGALKLAGGPEAGLTVSGFDLGECAITTTTVAIGHQAPTTVLAADPSRQWGIIQQPTNATNTVALNPSGNATIGSGFELFPATTTTYAPGEIAFGFSTDYRTGNAVTARTSTGSTSVKVIDCR